jgi:hypothetical protein
VCVEKVPQLMLVRLQGSGYKQASEVVQLAVKLGQQLPAGAAISYCQMSRAGVGNAGYDNESIDKQECEYHDIEASEQVNAMP